MTRVLMLATTLLVVAGCAGDRHSQKPKPPRNAVRIVATQSREIRGDYTRFHTEKELSPAKVEIEMGPAKGTSAGRIFLTPRAANAELASGPTILDSRGRLLWFLPRPGRVSNDLKPQTFKGRPVLTWGERAPVTTPAEIYTTDPKELYFVVADRNYRPFLRVRAIGEGVGTDMHEFLITKRNTVLLIGFKTVRRDLSAVGRNATWDVVDSIVQEIDLTTGKLLLDWSALEHVPLTDSMLRLPVKDAWDPYHANSVAVTADGNLLVSMRHTSAIYKIDRKTGKVLWTFGGKHSDFEIARRARFYFQHDAQALGDGQVLLFNNGSTLENRRTPYSSVQIFKLDGATRQATLVKEIVRDRAIQVVSQGNARQLKNGNFFVGWGNRQWFSEYTPEGQQLFDAALPSVAYQSYRALKGDWSGRPKTRPSAVADLKRGRTLLWVSWNGATEVASWKVLGGPTETTLRPLGTADWEGFETRLDVAAAPHVLRVQALNPGGKVLATSAAVRP